MAVTMPMRVVTMVPETPAETLIKGVTVAAEVIMAVAMVSHRPLGI
jgi:hypothetical protein